MKVVKKPINRAKAMKKAKHKLDKLFSKMVRDRKGGCFTCDRACEGSGRQAGHFQRRGLMNLRWHPKNVQIQCFRCNINLYGNQYEFGTRLDKKFGEGMASNLYKLGQKTRNWDLKEIEHLIEVLEKRPKDYEIEYALIVAEGINPQDLRNIRKSGIINR